MSSPVVLTDEPAPHVRRITLNRPEKRNALNNALRGGILQALQEADQDPAPRHARLDEHMGAREARDRPGTRLLPGGRQRARDLL